MSRKWSENEKIFLIDNYGNIRAADIASSLNRTTSSIVWKAKTLNLKTNYKLHRIYNVNEEYFELPTINNSYWAGFIAADGNLKKNKNLVRIKISKNDIILLNRFRSEVDYNGRIKEIYGKYVELSIDGVRNWKVDLLRNFNITENKTLTLQPPNIDNNDMIISYICGYIDGDGCISNDNNNVIIDLVGTEYVINWIYCKLESILGIKLRGRVRKSGKVYLLRFSNNHALILYKYMKSININVLDRKWDKIKKHYNE